MLEGLTKRLFEKVGPPSGVNIFVVSDKRTIKVNLVCLKKKKNNQTGTVEEDKEA